jgi:hypothetical protein
MKCANCSEDAIYVYRITFKKAIYYCKKDLPKFLDAQRKAGFLNIPKENKPEVIEVSTFVEETIEEALEDTKPVKKVAKKKAD